ncbi:hypothetical protein WDW86_00310 [Bdellovibrionota bacterium FG-2]
MVNTLLLISENVDDQTFASEVARVAGLTLRVAANVRAAVDFISDHGACVIFYNVASEQGYREFEDVIQEKIGIFSDHLDPNHIHFLCTESLDRVLYLLKSPLFGNFILRNYGDAKVSGAIYGKTVRFKCVTGQPGLGSFLKEGAQIQKVTLGSSLQKADAVEAVKNYLRAAKFQSRVSLVIANAVDELIMNAIFDAPVDEKGKMIYNSLPRSAEIQLEGTASVEMQLGFDGVYVGISVVDHFGSLDKARMLQYVSKSYTAEDYKVRMTSASAGIGLATVFQLGGSFIFNSQPKQRTAVTVLFQKTQNYREFKDQFRFLVTQIDR